MHKHFPLPELILLIDLNHQNFAKISKQLNQFNKIKAIIFYSQQNFSDFSLPENLPALQKLIKKLQLKGCLIIIAGSVKFTLDCGADGIHLEQNFNQIKELKAQHPNLIIGAGNLKTKHMAMEAGEFGADYLFYGSLSQTSTANKFLDLAKWNAETMKTPCVLLTELDDNSLNSSLNCLTDFIAVKNCFAKNITIEYINNIITTKHNKIFNNSSD